MQQTLLNSSKSDSINLEYTQFGDTKQILKYIFIKRVQLAVMFRDIITGKAEVTNSQIQAGKILLATLKDMEATTRQDVLDSIYTSETDDTIDNFTEGL
jgi:hypothetical protein